jgi:hypothetical protein
MAHANLSPQMVTASKASFQQLTTEAARIRGISAALETSLITLGKARFLP